MELQRKQEIKLIGKYYEKKMHKEYRLEVTDKNKLLSITPDSSFHHTDNKALLQTSNFCDYSYSPAPKFRTKNEMLESKKQKLVSLYIAGTINFQHKFPVQKSVRKTVK